MRTKMRVVRKSRPPPEEPADDGVNIEDGLPDPMPPLEICGLPPPTRRAAPSSLHPTHSRGKVSPPRSPVTDSPPVIASACPAMSDPRHPESCAATPLAREREPEARPPSAIRAHPPPIRPGPTPHHRPCLMMPRPICPHIDRTIRECIDAFANCVRAIPNRAKANPECFVDVRTSPGHSFPLPPPSPNASSPSRIRRSMSPDIQPTIPPAPAPVSVPGI